MNSKETATTSDAELTGADGVTLAALIAQGAVSAREVCEAHIRRIEEVNPRINALVVPTFDDARRQADEVDRARRRGEPLGPLAGVPITLKENFHLAGTPTTLGISHRANRLHTTDDEGPVVRQLRTAGAVVLGKANVPQLMLLQETDNPLYGTTTHPERADRSPGGSSGGDAALVASHAAVLAIGTDMGGSIRQPAHSCGIHGLKPTTGRLSMLGTGTNFNGMNAIGIQAGPLARSVADLHRAMDVLAAEPDVGGQLPPVPWLNPNEVDLETLRVGYLCDDGYFTPSPAIRRAVQECADGLRSRGVQVEPFEFPEVSEAVELFLGLTSADGGADARRMLARAQRQPQVRRLLRLANLPVPLSAAVGWLLRRTGQRRLADLLGPVRRRSAAEFWELCHRTGAWVGRVMKQMEEARLDAVLLPVHGLPALRHGTFMHLIGASSYCIVPNLLGAPCGTVAASRIDAAEESDREARFDFVDRLARDVERGSAGLPVGVQLMARHWREDVLLSLMYAAEQHFRTQPAYPISHL